MSNQIKYSVVFGNDHKNPLGVVQSLGQKGIKSIAVCWGEHTGLVKSSNFCSTIHYAETAEEGIKVLLNDVLPEDFDDIAVITPCSDEAALVLDKHRDELKEKYVFEYATHYSIERLLDKELQVKLAAEAGLDIPDSYKIMSLEDIPENPPFPCIIKPLVSMQGSKGDLMVCTNMDELVSNLKIVMPHNKGISLQRFIDKENDYTVLCCRLKDGTCIVPNIIRNDKLYPEQVGLSTLHDVGFFEDEQLQKNIVRLLNNMGYVGLISVEFSKSISDGKYYFFEFNIRNDGYNPCMTKSGVNINYYHYCDMLGIPFEIEEPKHVRIISEERHFMCVTHKGTTIRRWMRDIRESDGFTWYYSNDKKPFFRMFGHLFSEVFKYRILYKFKRK